MRRDDPRRHTLGGDILVYGSSQHPHAHQMPQQQRAMDLEVSKEPASRRNPIATLFVLFVADEYTSAKEQEESANARLCTR